jgi:hypothetical protein
MAFIVANFNKLITQGACGDFFLMLDNGCWMLEGTQADKRTGGLNNLRTGELANW